MKNSLFQQLRHMNTGTLPMKAPARSVRLAIGVLALVVAVAGAQAQSTSLVSVNSSGGQGTGDSTQNAGSRVSADGRFVTFVSSAPNLVAGDTNGVADVFVRDTVLNTTVRVSLDSFGVQGNGDCLYPSISADGHFVVFASAASNLVPGDTNLVNDLFLPDMTSGSTTRISLDSSFAQANDRTGAGSISADGHYVAFQSGASNLVVGDTNGQWDIFVRNTWANTTTRISVDSTGLVQSNDFSGLASISGDGKNVVFQSIATNLVSGDTNAAQDIFLHNMTTGSTTRVSVSSSGVQGNGPCTCACISADGNFVAFGSYASNLVSKDKGNWEDVFVRNLATGAMTLVSASTSGSQGNNNSGSGNGTSVSISGDGRYVAFDSNATNLAGSDTNNALDVFVRDRMLSTTTMASVTPGGGSSNGATSGPSFSNDGSRLTFFSAATNLVTGDANGFTDVFVRN